LDCLTHENGTHGLTKNICKKLSLCIL